MADTYHLLVAFPDREPVSFCLNKELITLGRSPDNDIQLLVREVSTSHCQFAVTPSGYEITDVGSTNGTKVNDCPVKNGRIVLNHHDSILFGETLPAYIVIAPENAMIDVKAEIAEIERAKAAPKKPTVQNLTAPVKKIGLTIKKPATSLPVTPTPGEGENAGSATVKLVQPTSQPTVKLASPPITKLAPPTPGTPPIKLASPGTPPIKLASPGTPPIKLASPGTPPVKLASPGTPPVKLASPGTPPVKLAPPGLQPPSKKDEAAADGPKLTLPTKKSLPKLNLPKKEE
jgi:pSer/pThr/pTyr-binding forkhead associated (FHA) protein